MTRSSGSPRRPARPGTPSGCRLTPGCASAGRRPAAPGGDGAVVRLLGCPGLRFGEMAALRVRRVDFLRRRLTIAEAVTEVGGRLEVGTPEDQQQRTGPRPG